VKLTLREIQYNQFNWEKLLKDVDPQQKWLELEILNNQDFWKRYYANDLEVFLIGANVTRNDPFEVFSFFREDDPVNPSGVTENYIKLQEENLSLASSRQAVTQIITATDSWIQSNAYALPLYSKNFEGCISPRLTGYKLGVLGPLYISYETVQLQ